MSRGPERERPSERRSATKRSPRTTLTLAAILDQARRILDAEGVEALTLRRLAADLGVGAASMYWHVDDKDELLDLCYRETLEPVTRVLVARQFDLADWYQGLHGLFSDLFDLFQAHPWVADVMSRQRASGPVVVLVWERIAEVLLGLGLDDEVVFHAGSALLSHLGAMSLIASAESVGRVSPEDREARLDSLAGALSSLDPDEFPALTRGIGIFRTHTEKAQFQGGLELILDGIRSRLPA